MVVFSLFLFCMFCFVFSDYQSTMKYYYSWRARKYAEKSGIYFPVPEAEFNLFELCMSLHHVNEAQQYFGESIERRGSSDELSFGALLQYRLLRKEYQKAREVIQRYVANDQQRPFKPSGSTFGLSVLAQIEEKLGHWFLAKELWWFVLLGLESRAEERKLLGSHAEAYTHMAALLCMDECESHYRQQERELDLKFADSLVSISSSSSSAPSLAFNSSSLLSSSSLSSTLSSVSSLASQQLQGALFEYHCDLHPHPLISGAPDPVENGLVLYFLVFFRLFCSCTLFAVK